MGIIHLDNARISDMMVFQALHVLPKAVKWDCCTQNICFRKKSLTSAFYTPCVSSVVNCATLPMILLWGFFAELFMNGFVARGLRENALDQHQPSGALPM